MNKLFLIFYSLFTGNKYMDHNYVVVVVVVVSHGFDAP